MILWPTAYWRCPKAQQLPPLRPAMLSAFLLSVASFPTKPAWKPHAHPLLHFPCSLYNHAQHQCIPSFSLGRVPWLFARDIAMPRHFGAKGKKENICNANPVFTENFVYRWVVNFLFLKYIALKYYHGCWVFCTPLIFFPLRWVPTLGPSLEKGSWKRELFDWKVVWYTEQRHSETSRSYL